uniref:Major facilitator superfamily (MFS) profile domain-containing protein n=1 Tax=Oryza brachyantha TaxID=4533 RepID=J3KVL8_ORYBR
MDPQEEIKKKSKKLSSHFESSTQGHGHGATPTPSPGTGTGTGTTPVDIRGEAMGEAELARTGGWVAALFIFGNEMAERMAYYGLSLNMVIFMFNVMHRPFAASANAVNNFLGISQASSLLGGFLADAYLGRYWTIAAFTTLYLLGLVALTLCATMPALQAPGQDECDGFAKLLGRCQQPRPWQMAYLYAALYTTALGAAGIRPCVSSFGADQFDERSPTYKRRLDRFFNLFYLAVTIGAIAAFTVLVYVQRNHGWAAAFGALAVAMGTSNALFFLGTPLYRHRVAGGSPLTRVAQVVVAAYRKQGRPEAEEGLCLYEVAGAKSAVRGSGKIEHTEELRWLDRAAVAVPEVQDDPWRVCTVTQVEEVKILVRLAPVAACTVMLSVVLTEFLTLSVQQAYTLNTRGLPVACMPVFPCLAILLLLALYYRAFAPLARRVTGHPHGASQLQRVGLGLLLSVLSVAWAALFERYRRAYAIRHGFLPLFLTPMPGLSAYWLLIQYCLIGLAENINVGRFDYLYWLLAVLSTINLLVFIYFAKAYKYRVKPADHNTEAQAQPTHGIASST